MSKENQSEKIINDKLNSREFAFDEKAWAGMETLLDAQEKKRRVGFFWWFSASVFVVLVAGAAWFLNNQLDLKNNVDLQETKIAINKTNTLSEKSNVVLNQSNTVLEKSETVSEKSNVVLNQNNTVLEKSKSALNQNNTVSEKSESVSEKSNAVLNQNNIVLEKSETVSEKSNAVLNQNNTVLEKSETAFNQNNTISEKNDTVLNQNNAFSAELAADSAKTTEQTLLTDSASLAETTKNPLTAPGKETKNAWGVLAGVGFHTSYKNVSGFHGYPDRSSKGFIGFIAGISYERVLTKRFEIGANVLYISRGALNSNKEFTNSAYGFGFENDKTVVSPKILHYVNIPLYLKFNVSQRHHIMLGASYSQLVATTYKEEHIIETNFTSTVVESEIKTGKLNGFKDYDISAFIGYEITVFNRMNAGLRFNYGFFDITDNKYFESIYFNNDHFDRNISLQLQLKYDLIRH